jgi:hypothetical protein
VSTPNEYKNDDPKDSFYEEIECVLDQFPKYHMKIMLKGLSAKVGAEDIFNQPWGMIVYMKLVTIMGSE